ncbi:MAG: hypothetical protein KAT62_03090 [Desulfuromonadales bacterium]|nr:hypothetical protein [Desulfuromonadales bacterium]
MSQLQIRLFGPDLCSFSAHSVLPNCGYFNNVLFPVQNRLTESSAISHLTKKEHKGSVDYQTGSTGNQGPVSTPNQLAI